MASLQARITALVQAVAADVKSLTTALAGKVAAINGTATGLTLNGGYKEGIFVVSGTTPALSPNNGSIQTWTLTGNSTPTAGTWASGQSIELVITATYGVTWTSLPVVWKTNGGAAPVLSTATFVRLEKIGTTIYGWRGGDN